MLCQLPQCLCRPVPAEPHPAVSFLLEQRGGISDSGWGTAGCPQPLSVAMPPQLDQGAGPGLCCVSLGWCLKREVQVEGLS